MTVFGKARIQPKIRIYKTVNDMIKLSRDPDSILKLRWRQVMPNNTTLELNSSTF